MTQPDAKTILIDSMAYDLEINRGKVLPYNTHDLRALFTLAGEMMPRHLSNSLERSIDFAVDDVAVLVGKARNQQSACRIR